MAIAVIQTPANISNSEDLMKGDGRWYIPKRYVLVILGCTGMINLFATRVNLSVSIVAMVNSSSVYDSGSVSNGSDILNQTQSEDSKTVNSTDGDLNWGPNTQGLILGAFFYGYTVTQIPGGILSEKFGGKWFYGGGVFISALLSFLTPLAASWGVGLLVFVRVIQGLVQGVTFPAIYTMISQWSHKVERSRSTGTIHMGSQVGSVVSLAVSGWLSSSDVLGGWPSSFYLFGIIGCIWFIFWAMLVYETPRVHPHISDKELKYLEETNNTQQVKPTTPWRAILTALPMWALIIGEFANGFVTNIFVTEIPTYFSTYLHFDVKNAGMLSALPNIAQAVGCCLTSCIADSLIRSNRISLTNVRKIFSVVGLIGAAVCLLAVTVSNCCPLLIIVFIILSRIINSFIYSGQKVVILDMSPTFAGTLYGIMNTLNSLSGFIGPAIVGIFTEETVTLEAWNRVFYICAALLIFAGLFFAIFGSADLQPWETSESTGNMADKGKKQSSEELNASKGGVFLQEQNVS